MSPQRSSRHRGAVAERRPEIAATTALSPAAKAAALRREALGSTDEEDDEDTDRPTRARWRWAAVATLVVLALGAALYAAYDWTRGQYYIGVDGANVAIYQGIPQDLGPVELSTLHEVTTIPLSDLPPFERSAVDATITVRDEAEADARVESLRQTAAACRLQRSQGTACGSGGS